MSVRLVPSSSEDPTTARPKVKLLDEVRELLRIKHYAYRTEQTYVFWIKRFIFFHGKRHPKEMGAEEVKKFLTFLAIKRNVTASTQNQALNALVFLYKQVLKKPFEYLQDVPRAKRPKRLPTVLNIQEVRKILDSLHGTPRLMVALLYGSGMRVMELLRLRVKDFDFEKSQITIRQGKGNKDRITVLPESLKQEIRTHLERVRKLYEGDLRVKQGGVSLPGALGVKYPQLEYAWGWQYLFPARGLCKDPRTGKIKRHHIHETFLQRAVKAAAKHVGITKHVGPHTLRHCFATHLLENGYDIRTVQDLLGHKHVETTMIYTHVLNRPGIAVKSPLERL